MVEEHRTTIEEMRELLHGRDPARLCCIVFACIFRECAGVARTMRIRCEHGPTPGTFNRRGLNVSKGRRSVGVDVTSRAGSMWIIDNGPS